MKKIEINKRLNPLNNKYFGGRVTLKSLSIAALVGAVSFGTTAMAEEVYPGVNVPDEVYKTEYGDKENYSEIKYFKWSQNENGVKSLVDGDATNFDYKYYVSSDKTNITDIKDVIVNSTNDNNIDSNFLDIELNNKTNLIKNTSNYSISSITGDYVRTSGNTRINNSGIIDSINITAIGNDSGDVSTSGSIIYNGGANAHIKEISGTFIGNYNKGNSIIYDVAGAKIDSIKGTFIGNKMIGSNVWGAAIGINNNWNSHVDSIEGIFIDNYNNSRGGAIANGGVVDSIKGIFINNRADAEGAAIWQYGVATKIEGYFEGNKGSYAIQQYKRSLPAGYKYNSELIKGVFVNNPVGAIFLCGQKVKDIEGVFINNGVAVHGAWGAHYVDNINGYFANNNTAIIAGGSTRIYNITGDFLDNKHRAITISGGRIGVYDEAEENLLYGGITNSSFYRNHVQEDENTSPGGAIYTDKDVNIIADAGLTEFKDNYTMSDGERDDNAIYVNNAATVNFQSVNNGKIEMYDNIRGASTEKIESDEFGNEFPTVKNYSVNITGDKTGSFGMYNDMYDANVAMGNTNLNTINNLTHTYNFNSLTLTGDVNATVDVDLKNKEMDRFTANEYGEHQGNLNVSGMNLLSEAKDDQTEIFFAEDGLKDNVTTTVKEVAYTPIYKYDVTYDNRGDGGYFIFNRGASAGGNPSDTFNPSVLSAPVSSVAASQATINETFHHVFAHADAFTQMPLMERVSRINANKYALSTDYNYNLGSLRYEQNNKAGWFRPYVTFEKMSLKNGPKVDAITYGSLAGFDTDFHEHRNGWHSVGTGYIGYNGNQLHYSGVSTTMNGGLLGYTHTMYKGNFWSALTLSAGASVGESRTMYGKEDFTSLMAGVGSKTGYNFEFKEGKYILQPIMFMSYTMVNTFDYTNAAGVRVKPSPAHSIQLNPSVRFIANTQNGWQPYVSAGVVWNVMNENKVMANAVRLPEMNMKPYVEYGLGVQRNWKDKFTAFGQAMIRNGGRNGIALTGGFRWALGNDSANHNEKVENNNPINTANATSAPTRTILKQLSDSQRVALRAKTQNTTITSHIAVIK